MISRRLPYSIPRHAWTGGDAPAPGCMSPAERSLTRERFRLDMLDWSECWGRPVPLDTARVLWNRARHDAYASLREYMRKRPATARRDHRLTGMAARI